MLSGLGVPGPVGLPESASQSEEGKCAKISSFSSLNYVMLLGPAPWMVGLG